MTWEGIAGGTRRADDGGMTTPPPVLLIHGLFSKPAFMQPWADRFAAAGHEVHVVGLPGRDPVDQEVLRRTSIDAAFAVVRRARAEIDRPPVIVGHSFGGLLAQKLAAATDCAGLVLLASVPPGVLWAQPAVVPALVRLMPSVLAGRAVLPSDRTMRRVPLSTLAPAEQDVVVPEMVPDSGRVFRSMLVGARSTRVPKEAVTCPVLAVTAGADRNVPRRSSEAIARRYGADHLVHETAPHWIIAESLIDEVAPGVLDWVARLA